MKDFFKVFGIALVVFLVAIGAGLGIFNLVKADTPKAQTETGEQTTEDDFDETGKTPLEVAIHYSKRVNAVFMGVETENRSDTIMFVSFDPETSDIDIISIPRDTYYYEPGYDKADQRKINAAYGRGQEDGIKKAIGEILGVPIHYYGSVKYEGVKAIVDSIGGVDVNVPVRMKYSDPTDTPPLKIDLQKGQQTLDGAKSIQFLRYRHGNMGKNGHYMGGYPDGDLGRIKAQQQFVTNAIQKIVGLKLPTVVRTALPYITTDAGVAEIMFYEKEILNIKPQNIHTETLPGEAKTMKFGNQALSFYEVNEEEAKTIAYKLYGVIDDSTTTESGISTGAITESN